jgi:hypothetical protein
MCGIATKVFTTSAGKLKPAVTIETFTDETPRSRKSIGPGGIIITMISARNHTTD